MLWVHRPSSYDQAREHVGEWTGWENTISGIHRAEEMSKF